ncbi:MAG: hypothetical protein IIX90_05405 [Clostridia bacterium]|nr:hypothetical protein [Clostridia bacterium]
MNYNAKAKSGFPYVTLILVVTILLIVAIVGYTLVDSLGIIAHFDNAAKSNRFKLNENHVDVYRFHIAQNQYYTEYLYYQYGMMQDYYGVTKMYASGAEYANAMIPQTVGSGSFDAAAYSYAEQYLTYCEAATDDNLYEQYKNDTADDVDTYVEGLRNLAKANGLSFSSYLKKWMGNGVSERDVRTAMEYYYIGIEYAEKIQAGYEDSTTLEEMEKYRDENKANFYSTKYTSYKLVNNDLKTAIDACKTADEVKTAIVDYYLNQKFDDLYKKNITEKNITDEAGKDATKANVRTTILALNEIGENEAVFKSDATADFDKAAYTICTTINTSAKIEVNKVAETSAAYADVTASSATDLQKWLFGTGRKVGDYTVLETKTTSKDSTTGKETTVSTYTWYLVEEVMVLDTEHTKDAYYIKLADDAEGTKDALTAVQKAEAMMEALKADKSPEKFKELVEKYAPGYSSEMIEKITFESMKSVNEDLANWLYDESRKEGDLISLEAKEDSKDADKVTGVYICLFQEENEETWKMNARESVASQKRAAWYQEAVKKYNVVVDYTPETTAATTTTATTTSATTTAVTEPETTVAETDAVTEPETTDAAEVDTQTETA